MNNILLLASLASLMPFGNSMKVTARVKDTDGVPAAGAIVKVWTDKDRFQGLCKSSTYSYYEVVTDTNGIAELSFPCYSSSINACAYGDLYYSEDSGYIPIKSTFNWSDFSVSLKEHSKDVFFTLRRKRNPISLCYAKANPGVFPKLPKAGGEFGFDLLMDDWVAPYGDGKDVDFYVQREVSPTNSEETLNSAIVFRGDGNGAYIRNKVKTTSDFKTDYEADTNGIYQTCLPLRHYPAPGNPAYTFSSIVKEDEYIVMRTRVEKNAKGEIIKAHYSAMLGPVYIGKNFDWLIYYINPTPNDPNLEKSLRGNVNLVREKKRRRQQYHRPTKIELKK